MLKVALGLPACLILIIALDRCIDPYTPHLDSYQKLLVVEGLITNEKILYEVILTIRMKKYSDTSGFQPSK